MKKILFGLIIIALSTSCISTKRTTDRDYVRVYTVPADEHYSTREIEVVSNPVKGTIYTDASWSWPVPGANGWSKVTGIGIAKTIEKEGNRVTYMVKDIQHEGVTKTAGIFGWYICDDGYCDYSPKRIAIDTIFNLTKKHKFDFELGFKGNDKAYIIWDGQYKEMPFSHAHGLFYLNHAYIGGTYTIKHDWKVKIMHRNSKR